MIFAVQENAAGPVLLLKRLGLVRARVVVVNVALLKAANIQGWRRAIWQFLLKGSDLVISFASAQVREVCSIFGVHEEASQFVPLGVDTMFLLKAFADAESKMTEDSGPLILSVGTNSGRDFVTFARAITALDCIARGLIVCDSVNAHHLRSSGLASGPNLELVAGLPYQEVVSAYGGAAIGVVSLHDRLFSTGQTVMLEMMASGLAVVVTDCVATRDYVVDGETGVVVPPGDVPAMAAAIRRLLANPVERTAMGLRAQDAVMARFTADQTGQQIANLLAVRRESQV